jgi:hypothetical protein
MVFWYFRTMFLRLVEGGELELCEARSRCYTWLLVRSKANFNSDVSRSFTDAKRPPRQRLSSNGVVGSVAWSAVKVVRARTKWECSPR